MKGAELNTNYKLSGSVGILHFICKGRQSIGSWDSLVIMAMG
jgi:hypothetical protein